MTPTAPSSDRERCATQSGANLSRCPLSHCDGKVVGKRSLNAIFARARALMIRRKPPFSTPLPTADFVRSAVDVAGRQLHPEPQQIPAAARHGCRRSCGGEPTAPARLSCLDPERVLPGRRNQSLTFHACNIRHLFLHRLLSPRRRTDGRANCGALNAATSKLRSESSKRAPRNITVRSSLGCLVTRH